MQNVSSGCPINVDKGTQSVNGMQYVYDIFALLYTFVQESLRCES